MIKRITKPEGIPIRYFVDDDRNYNMLNEECIHAQTRYTELVIKNDQDSIPKISDWVTENMRNGMTQAEAFHAATIKSIEPLQKPLKALQDLMALRDAIKHEKKILEDIGHQRCNQQTEFAGKRHEEAQQKHAQWQKWQVEEIAENSRFAELSKIEQARRLKKKHAIVEPVGTIRKRLA
jgi:hypothetical protein